MHERLAFVYRDFSTRLQRISPTFLSLSLSLLCLSLSLLLFLLPIHANGGMGGGRGRKRAAARKEKEDGKGRSGGDAPLKDTIYRNTARRGEDGADKEAECGVEREKRRTTVCSTVAG